MAAQGWDAPKGGKPPTIKVEDEDLKGYKEIGRAGVYAAERSNELRIATNKLLARIAAALERAYPPPEP
ncbi:MAG: hypothetical protein ACLP74_01505 [Thermoplasmata archaeon]